MTDLIRRQAAIEELHKQCVKRRMDGEGELFDEFDIEDVLRKLPSAEPERKKGHWLPHPGDEDWDVCSVCGTGCKRREHGNDGWVTEYNYQFCPFCGADMRGDR